MSEPAESATERGTGTRAPLGAPSPPATHAATLLAASALAAAAPDAGASGSVAGERPTAGPGRPPGTESTIPPTRLGDANRPGRVADVVSHEASETGCAENGLADAESAEPVERPAYWSIAGTPAGILERPPEPNGPVFAHPSEREFARILDFHRIAWQYEPRSFVLRAHGDRLLEMFSPDFYLPELDLYIELTTLRQRLVTRKNRKLRLLRELYPDVRVTLLYRRDYQELLAKYGYGPAELDNPEAEAIRTEADRILFSQQEIAEAVGRLGRCLTHDYAGRAPILVGLLKGVTFFLADLIRAVDLPLAVDYMAVTELGSGGGAVRIVKDLDLDIHGRDVVLVEDIVDTGMTLRYILGHLAARGPAGLAVCTLLDKRARRLVDVPIEYVGFELADEFVVGYGLDYHQRYRNLPFLARIRPELYRPNAAG